jgi:subtilase family serine protease
LKPFLTALLTLVLVLMLPMTAAAASARSTLKGSTPPWANAAHKRAAADPSDWVNFRVYVELSDAAGAEALAQAVSDPRSASYGKYVSAAQFDRKFGSSAADASAIASWLTGQGLTVDGTASNNRYVSAEGTVAQVQAAFGTSLNVYSVNGKSLRSNATDLTVPTGLTGAIAGILIAFMAGVLTDLDTGITNWAKAHNPFFDGPNADWLALLPFLALAALLYLVGREVLLASKAPKNPDGGSF